MYITAAEALDRASHIVVIQAENPDGDSLGSALALEELLGNRGKQVSMYCKVNIPSYLRYFKGWDRVTADFPRKADLAIIVDTASATLLQKALSPEVRTKLSHMPVIVFDHHVTKGDLPFPTIDVLDPSRVATGELLLDFAEQSGWDITPDAADNLLGSILADSLGLTTEGTSPESVRSVAKLMEYGTHTSQVETRRREFMRKSPEILAYKGRLLQRIDYFLDGALAVIHIPWEEIEEYSDRFNPSVLVLDEMRLVDNVKIAVAIKTYPDGRITGKLRANPEAKIAEMVAGYFGGGGHPFSAGFRVYDNYETVIKELVNATDKALQNLSNTASKNASTPAKSAQDGC
ncbi:DHH family phosphoesterase [Candidatus Saccharibacteria bacterium]|nr:DHH family phosphoesterase [Candidatus Saccharibacteria bacterium]